MFYFYLFICVYLFIYRGFRMGAYDQFAENHSKFGVQSDFDITMYSTRVNANEVPEYVFC